MKSASILSKLLLRAGFLFAVISIVVSGCKNGPFSPEAKMVVTSVGETILAPTPDEGNTKDNVVLPNATVTLKLLQGTSVFIERFTIDYYKTDDTEIKDALGNSLQVTGKLTAYLLNDTDLQLSLPVYSRKVYDVIHPSNDARTDLNSDTSPINAVIRVYGTDANSNHVACTGYVTLITLPSDMITGS
ncbi:MAG: hypothetical protein PHQ23_16490 [Candidatus Wallbacteria bacterium]|nr:hypothetical protein [Candidatus Wallbacteria bacterium]